MVEASLLIQLEMNPRVKRRFTELSIPRRFPLESVYRVMRSWGRCDRDSALTKSAVDLKLLCGKLGQHGLVGAAVGFCDKAADLTLTAFEATGLERVKGVFDLFGEGLRGIP